MNSYPNIDRAIASGYMTSVDVYEAVETKEAKAYVMKYHMDEELEMHLGK